jgi:hypothetical protein
VSLSPSIGIVWTGPQVVSVSITRAQIDAARARLGGRPMLLYDNFPMNDETPPNAFALALVPLSGRDPGIAESLAGYLACPMPQLGASRFTLATIADFLRDPGRYEPKVARERALTRLLGPKAPEATRFALDTQQIEWGSWPRDPATPAATAGRLHDPAFVASFTWTAERYPGRIAALETPRRRRDARGHPARDAPAPRDRARASARRRVPRSQGRGARGLRRAPRASPSRARVVVVPSRGRASPSRPSSAPRGSRSRPRGPHELPSPLVPHDHPRRWRA